MFKKKKITIDVAFVLSTPTYEFLKDPSGFSFIKTDTSLTYRKGCLKKQIQLFCVL